MKQDKKIIRKLF